MVCKLILMNMNGTLSMTMNFGETNKLTPYTNMHPFSYKEKDQEHNHLNLTCNMTMTQVRMIQILVRLIINKNIPP
jgi:hypothetical protein